MESLILADGAVFSTGAIFGGLLLFAGIILGLILGRHLIKLSTPGFSSEDVLKIVSQFKQVTHGVAADMSEYREVMDLAQRRIQDMHENPAVGDDSALQLLAQMTQANELLQRRIADAETTLNHQSEQMAAAMTEARTDKLTQLANRRAFEDEFQRRTAEFRRHGSRFLLMIIDIDRFKHFNDTFGHHAGDAVLSQLAAVLQKTVRDTDLAARFGGEEFVLLLPAGEMSHVTDSMERIRLAVEGAEFHLEDRTIRVTVSCGSAEPQVNETSESLLKRADTALYAAKKAGRNCCFFHTGSACIPLTPTGSTAQSSSLPDKETPAHLRETFHDVCSELRRKLEEVTRR